MNEEKNYKLYWYLPDKEKSVKIPVTNDEDSKISDEYLAQIIKEFYYAEALSEIEDDDLINRINNLNDMHGDIILLKRIFNDVLVSSENIIFKRNEKQIIDENIWNKLNEIVDFYDIHWLWLLEQRYYNLRHSSLQLFDFYPKYLS